MRKNSTFQKFMQELRDSTTCHLSSDDEWPTIILQKEEIYRKDEHSNHKITNQIPENETCGKILNEGEAGSILGRSLRTCSIKNYIDATLLSSAPRNLRQNLLFRHSSMTKYEIKDLVQTEIVNRLLVEEKKWADYNINILLNTVKDIHMNEKKEYMKKLLESLGHVLVTFLVSNITDLKYNRCKIMIEEIDKLETFFYNKFSQSQADSSPMNQKTDNLINLIELNLDDHQILEIRKTMNIDSQLLREKSSKLSSILQTSYKEYRKVFLKAQYILCKIGHTINYYQMNNCLYGIHQKSFENLVKQPLVYGKRPTDVKPRGLKISDSDSIDSKSSQIDLNFLPAEEIEAVGKTSKITCYLDKKLNLYEEENSQNSLIEKENMLTCFLTMKAKKWIGQHKKVIVEKMRKELERTATKKLKDQQLICSICGKNLAAEILTEHSAFCRRRMELRKELGNIHTNISNDIFNALQIFREMSTKSRILRKDIQKKEQKLKSTFTPSNRNSRDFGTNFTSYIEKQNTSFEQKSAMSTCDQIFLPCDQMYKNDNEPNLSISRVSSETTKNDCKIVDASPQSTLKSSPKKSGKRYAKSNTFGTGDNVDAIPEEEEESSTPINRMPDNKFLTQEIKELDIIEEGDEINTHPKQQKLLRMQFEDEPEENEEKFTISLKINEPRVKTLKKKALACILDEKQYYSDSQLRKSNIPEDSSKLIQKPSLIKKNSEDKGDDVILISKSPQSSSIDDSFLYWEDNRLSEIVISYLQSEESDEYPERAISRNCSLGSNKNVSKSRFYVETRHSFSRFSKQSHEESMNTCFDNDDANLLERSEGKSFTSKVIDNRLSYMKREVPRFEQRKQIISKLKELRKILANTYAKIEICGLIESTGKEFPPQEEFNIKMEIALKEAREKLEEIEKRYKNAIIYQTLGISHFFTHVEQLIDKSKELSDIQRKMEQLEATEKKSLQQPLTKDGKSKSFRYKNGLKIAKLDIESAKQKMFDLSTQSPLTLSSQKSNRLVPSLSGESDASFDTGNSSSPKYTPKQSSKPYQLFNSESSPLLRSVQKKSSLNQSKLSSLYQQQPKENTLDVPDESKSIASSRKSLLDEIKISTADEVVNKLSSTLSGTACSESAGQTAKILNKETILEKEPPHTKLLPVASDSGTNGLKDTACYLFNCREFL